MAGGQGQTNKTGDPVPVRSVGPSPTNLQGPTFFLLGLVRLGSDWFGLVRLGQVILIRRVPHAQTEQPSEPNQPKLIRTKPSQPELTRTILYGCFSNTTFASESNSVLSSSAFPPSAKTSRSGRWDANVLNFNSTSLPSIL